MTEKSIEDINNHYISWTINDAKDVFFSSFISIITALIVMIIYTPNLSEPGTSEARTIILIFSILIIFPLILVIKLSFRKKT